ncbi:hypothetical protein M8J77_023079 [Diaphorina citri]|nr:hypothetical protein M8J77_023079 [Diaphorina citri]
MGVTYLRSLTLMPVPSLDKGGGRCRDDRAERSCRSPEHAARMQTLPHKRHKAMPKDKLHSGCASIGPSAKPLPYWPLGLEVLEPYSHPTLPGFLATD